MKNAKPVLTAGRFAAAFLCAGALCLMATSAVEAGEETHAAEEQIVDPSLRGCGHAGELLAARDALADGDRPGAIAHLKAARALLVECERDQLAADPKTPDSDTI